MTTLPTIAQLKSNFIAAFQGEFNFTLNPFGQAFLEATAIVVAGMLWVLYLAVAACQNNIWVDTCDYPTLLRFGRTILKRSPFAAQPGIYTATVTGTVGATIPGTSVFQSDPTSQSPGFLFQIIGGAYIMPGSTGTITIQALTGGLISGLAIGNTLTSTSPILNVNSSIVIASIITSPIDAETEQVYRQNVIDKIQLDPGSWSAVDYRLVGTGIDGVAQTYAYLNMSDTNTVDVYLQGAVALAFPGPSVSSTVTDAYAAAIALLRPIGTFVINTYSSPINNVDITITMGSFPAFNADQKTAIANALRSFVNGITPFIASCDSVATRNDKIYSANLATVISQAVPGYGFSSATFEVAGTPLTYWLADTGNIAFMNSITYA